MKLNLENPEKMVLEDHNYTLFAMGIVFFLIGIGMIVLSLPKNLGVAGAGLLFGLVGAFLFLTAEMVTVTLDKMGGKCSILRKGIIKRETKEVELKRIKGVTFQTMVRTSHSHKGGTTTTRTYILKFMLDNGEEIPIKLAQGSSSGITLSMAPPGEAQRKQAKQVADFLGVPLNEIAPPSVSDVVSMVSRIMEGKPPEGV